MKTFCPLRSIAFAITLLFSANIAFPVSATDGKRPNILFIIADDQSPFDFKFYNPDSALEAPTIEKLAAGGMVLDGAYHMGAWSGAVCTPSRHMVMCQTVQGSSQT